MSNVRSHEHVPSCRIFLAALAGAVLYYLAVVLLGGGLAAVAVPRGFFDFFGHEHTELALAGVNMLSPAWWDAPNILSPWTGLALALWAYAKRPQRSRSVRSNPSIEATFQSLLRARHA